jgi:hypothetical protein
MVVAAFLNIEPVKQLIAISRTEIQVVERHIAKSTAAAEDRPGIASIDGYEQTYNYECEFKTVDLSHLN